MNIFRYVILLIISYSLSINYVIAQNNNKSGSYQTIKQVEDQPNPGIDHKFSEKLPGNIQIQQILNLDAVNENTGLSGNRNNTAIINQFGNNNIATLNQRGLGNTGVIQMGSPENRVFGNDVTVNQQGNQLLSISEIQGNNNSLDLLQTGQNVGSSFLLQGNNLQFDAIQQGNSIQLQPQNGTTPPINITSTRQNLPVIISNN